MSSKDWNEYSEELINKIYLNKFGKKSNTSSTCEKCENKILKKGNYKIKIGNGGNATKNGEDSYIKYYNNTEVIIEDNYNNSDGELIINKISLIGYGGGYGAGLGDANDICRPGNNGGSGGGGYQSSKDPTCFNNGKRTQGKTLYDGTKYIYGGNNGSTVNSIGYAGCGGGAGGNAIDFNINGPGYNINITNNDVTYAVGGKSGNSRETANGFPNTGNGGNGGYRQQGQQSGTGSKGGSGVIIIKYNIMSLLELVDNSRTDKNTVHSYLELYQNLLINKKDTAKNVLEVGIQDGGSIKLWSNFFINANVYGIDIMKIDKVWEGIKNKNNIILHTSCDAYNDNFFINNFLNKNIKYDFMLDDGPHTLESMKKFIKLYSQIMTDDGILIIEDVQSWDWIDILKNEVPEDLKQFIKIYDLRPNKNRYDDIVFTIDKSNIQKIEN